MRFWAETRCNVCRARHNGFRVVARRCLETRKRAFAGAGCKISWTWIEEKKKRGIESHRWSTFFSGRGLLPLPLAVALAWRLRFSNLLRRLSCTAGSPSGRLLSALALTIPACTCLRQIEGPHEPPAQCPQSPNRENRFLYAKIGTHHHLRTSHLVDFPVLSSTSRQDGE